MYKFAPNLNGRWVYTIQGLMQWTNPDNLTVDPQHSYEWGWAFAADPENRKKHQKFAGFTPIPLTVVNLYPYVQTHHNLNKEDVPVDEKPDLPKKEHWKQTLPGEATKNLQPDPAVPPEPPVSGYLPYAESGYIEFFPEDRALRGQLWITVAGNSLFDTPFDFDGRFRFNEKTAYAQNDTWLRPIVGMSFQLAFKVPFFWDYSVIMVSSNEAQIITGGRYPRPCTGSGTMKRALWNELYGTPNNPF